MSHGGYAVTGMLASDNYLVYFVHDIENDFHVILLHRKLSQKEHFELRSLQTKFVSESASNSRMGEDHVVTLPWKELHTVGFYYDVPQVCGYDNDK